MDLGRLAESLGGFYEKRLEKPQSSVNDLWEKKAFL